VLQQKLLRLQKQIIRHKNKDLVFFLSEQSDYLIRGCTGFDGDLEIMEAIDGPGPSKNLELNINADNKLAYAA